MKKKILSTAIALSLTISTPFVFANQESGDWENELDKISEGFSGVNIELSDISELLKNNGIIDDEQNEIETKKSIEKESYENKKNTTAVIPENTKKENKKDKVLDIDESIEFDEKEESIDFEENDEPIFKIDLEDKKVVEYENDNIFLRNIPEGTRILALDNFIVLPKKRFIIFHNGERVLKSPQTKENPNTKFCFVELVNSGKGRILKNRKSLTVTANKTEVKEYDLSKSYGEYVLRTYQTAFGVDNKNIKNFTCYSAETYQKGIDKEPLPLKLKDLREITGYNFKIDFPSYEEI